MRIDKPPAIPPTEGHKRAKRTKQVVEQDPIDPFTADMELQDSLDQAWNEEGVNEEEWEQEEMERRRQGDKMAATQCSEDEGGEGEDELDGLQRDKLLDALYASVSTWRKAYCLIYIKIRVP